MPTSKEPKPQVEETATEATETSETSETTAATTATATASGPPATADDELWSSVDEVVRGVQRLRAASKHIRTKQPGEIERPDMARLQRQLHAMEGRVKTQSEALKRNQALWGKILRKEGVQWAHEWEEQRLTRRLERLAGSTRPVLVGPWTGEVGIELLYWIPFVSWVYANTPISPERTVIVSRGGVESWYGGIGRSYADVLEVIGPEGLQQAMQRSKKQRRVSPVDCRFMRLVQSQRDNRALQLLHPSMMYELFGPFWRGESPASVVEAATRYRMLERPAPAPWSARLPREYVAVKFYFANQFPNTPENRQFVTQTVERLAKRYPVVLLEAPVQVDDHETIAPTGENIYRLDDVSIPVERNLEFQSQVVAHAKMFVGTYGGLAHLAPYYGVPCLMAYSTDRGFFRHHLELAQRVFHKMTDAPFLVLRTDEWNMMRAAVDAL